jgi:hypothetical protein
MQRSQVDVVDVSSCTEKHLARLLVRSVTVAREDEELHGMVGSSFSSTVSSWLARAPPTGL